MKWFKQNYTTCKECGVHFEPLTNAYDSRWKHLCSVHREPVKQKLLMKDAALCWAEYNWERIYQLMKEDEAKAIEKMGESYMKFAMGMMNNQNTSFQQTQNYPWGGI